MESGAISVAVTLFKETFPSLDDDISSYIESILTENAEHFDSEGDVHDAIGGVLDGFHRQDNDQEIKILCKKIYQLMRPSDGFVEKQITLDAPVQMASLLDTFSERVVDNSSIWMMKKQISTVVDPKKLEKAEAKIKEKQLKKAIIGRPGNAGRAIEVKEDERATVCQQTDRRELASSSHVVSHVGDIRLENFDIAYGSRGDLRLPPGVRVLHVEQEVVGDSTPALESVLQADIERHTLLIELARLQAEMKKNSGTDQGLSSSTSTIESRVAEIYSRLNAIEADKAPARAAVSKPTKEFSGGWRMRLALAQALFAKPDLLLLDEPTNMLDMRAIIWLEDYLQSSSNILLIVSHDRSFLNTVATDIIHLNCKRLDAYRGNYDAFEQARSERLLNQQREYESLKAEREHIQQFIDKFRYNAKRASLVQSRIKHLEKLPPLIPPEKELKVVIRLPDCEKLSPPLLQLDEVCFHYVLDKPILNHVNLSISPDSRISIVGENGAGKTTLLRLLLGDLEPTSGLRHAHRSLRIGYFSQHHVDQLDLKLSSLEFLMRKFPNQTEQVYRSQLANFNITEMLALQPIGSLSGGQKSRVAFVAMCMSNPNMLVLDEPTNHLDVETIAGLSDALVNFPGGVVLVSHDERLIQAVCNEVWVCTRMGISPVDSAKGSRVYSLPGGLEEYKKAVRVELVQLKL
ncbi:ATP-binding cassette, subfamily F, member 3 [Schistosoma bovis]|uniref:ATP-binding cassette, subfamily F, member 3 n=1 Tax=Schistosoma bovis TaxID=6184 RepID=A0A430QQ37_SCHBO|nr:ATP-binding cassette, subfamily F, member 3 [Schistosoma bovis]